LENLNPITDESVLKLILGGDYDHNPKVIVMRKPFSGNEPEREEIKNTNIAIFMSIFTYAFD